MSVCAYFIKLFQICQPSSINVRIDAHLCKLCDTPVARFLFCSFVGVGSSESKAQARMAWALLFWLY